MASKDSLSNGNEVQEVTQLIRAFEQQSSMRIAIVLTVVKRAGKDRLLVRVGPFPNDAPERVLEPWGLPQSVSEAGDVVTLMAALTNGMYGLDYELAEAEWGKLREPSA